MSEVLQEDFLEEEMEYRMCSKVSSHTNNFHREFPQRGDTTITNFIVSIDTPSKKKPEYWILKGAAFVC